jgi:hypothetical protein
VVAAVAQAQPPPQPPPAATEPVHFQELPDPSLLPPSYLLRCVQFARQMQADLAKALDQPVPARGAA